MLDAFIIDQLRREREGRQWEPVPLELPVPPARPPEADGTGSADDGDEPSGRGVVIIDNTGVSTTL